MAAFFLLCTPSGKGGLCFRSAGATVCALQYLFSLRYLWFLLLFLASVSLSFLRVLLPFSFFVDAPLFIHSIFPMCFHNSHYRILPFPLSFPFLSVPSLCQSSVILSVRYLLTRHSIVRLLRLPFNCFYTLQIRSHV